MENSSGAHGAGFQRDVESAIVETIVAQGLAGVTDGDDLGVGGGVVVAEDPVVAAGDDLSCGSDDDCAYGHFACGLGGVGLSDGDAEVDEVGGERLGHLLLV